MSIRHFRKDLEKSAKGAYFILMIKNFLCSHSVHMTLFFRLGQSLSRLPIVGTISRLIIEYLIRIIFSSDLSCKAKIGPGLVFVHGHDIVIGADVLIGENCKIFNGVTFGNKDLDKSSLGNQPTIGDNCIVCTGAKILGDITIGNNVVIAANAVVIKNCMPNTVVGGVPAKTIKANY